jgi:hypothetical protein
MMDDDDPHIHPSIYIRIAQHLRSTFLFPSLRHLKFDMDDGLSIFLLLSPLLESLELTHIRNEEHTIVKPLLANLSSQMLRRLVLRNGVMSADFFKKSIVNIKQLRSLELLDADSSALYRLWRI